jgi:hypothetical protein
VVAISPAPRTHDGHLMSGRARKKIHCYFLRGRQWTEPRGNARQAQFRSRIAMPDLPLMTLIVLTTAFSIEVAWLIYA